MREWTVAGGIVEGPDGVLLVRNRRRWGTHDWSPPGGVIDDSDADVQAGLTREVHEETGITVSGWHGPVYEVSAVALDMGWHMHVHVFVAQGFAGDLTVDDPDGIVDDAEFAAAERCAELLEDCFRWVREPFGEWLEERWDATARRHYRYEVRGTDLQSLQIDRLFE